MSIFVLCALYLLTPRIQADPNTIQIQNYDGPIFLHSPKPNCCPYCNSLLPQPPIEDPCESSIPEEYLRTKPYGTNDGTLPPVPGTGLANAYTPVNSGNQLGIAENALPGTVCENTNTGTILHKNTEKPGIVFNVPLTANTFTAPIGHISHETTGTLGNTYLGTTPRITPGTLDHGYNGAPCENTGPGTIRNFCGTNQPTISGTECSCTCVTRPLSSYLPINTCQNTCSFPKNQNTYNLPIAKNQVFGEEEPVLVPQKFSYSLVLDGEIAPTFNQYGTCDCRCYCYC